MNSLAATDFPPLPLNQHEEKDNSNAQAQFSDMAYNDLEDETTQELRALGINFIDQISLEQNVAAAVDKAVASHGRKQKFQILKKEVKKSNLEILKVQKKKDDLQHRLKGMRQRLTDPRQYMAVEKSLKDSEEHISGLKTRIAYIEDKLLQSNENDSVLDDVDLNLEEGEIIDEAERLNENSKMSQCNHEKLIQEGKMTPFGTVLEIKEKPLLNIGCNQGKITTTKKAARELTKGEETVDDLATSTPQLPNGGVTTAKSSYSMTGMSEFEKYLQDQIHKQKSHFQSNFPKKTERKSSEQCYGNFRREKRKAKEFIGSPPLTDGVSVQCSNNETKKRKSPLKQRILHPKRHWKEKNLSSVTSDSPTDLCKRVPKRVLSECVSFPDENDVQDSDSDYVPSAVEEDSSSGNETDATRKTPRRSELSRAVDQTQTTSSKRESSKNRVKNAGRKMDDGYVEKYMARIQRWRKEKLKEKQRRILEGEDEDEESGHETFGGGLKIPLSLWNKLYKYQKTCVKWLWELHTQQCGGILGDEMGLGKTVMVISFLAGLSYSGLVDRGCRGGRGLGPVLILAPATLLHQWVREFHNWWPPFRVAVLHDSGSFAGQRSALIHNIHRHGGILVTSYHGGIRHLKVLLNYDWHYVILDEGHKIRNPEAQITVAVKRFQTPHRIILSGSPIQNSLKELWSLFDFIYPGKLGSLPVFLQQFAVPITQGGYANATKLEVQTAYRCATVLRDTINPYLLRRMKNDVRTHLSLPDKNEQVLFCGLTEEQRTHYRDYLAGNQVNSILSGKLQVFVGLINLRKICNHPDLYDGGPRRLEEEVSSLQPEYQYGWWKRAGKMVVLHSILKLWKGQGHRVLVFTQSRQMMCILEKYLQDTDHSYLKMNGTTSVSSRQPLIERFNEDSSIFVFLLTTRVGGLGVNLTGADRVLLYDPDWNPSTDSQARERAWRIGQKRDVTIYRLLTAGTIEEKIYHRQIFKQFLTNRVLKDPKQQRFFKTNDLHELFTLNEGMKEKTESAAIFAGTGSEISISTKRGHKPREKILNKKLKTETLPRPSLSPSNRECCNVVKNVTTPDVKDEFDEPIRSKDKEQNHKRKATICGQKGSVLEQENEFISKVLSEERVQNSSPQSVSFEFNSKAFKDNKEDANSPVSTLEISDKDPGISPPSIETHLDSEHKSSKPSNENTPNSDSLGFDDEKRRKMLEFAKLLSKKIGEKNINKLCEKSPSKREQTKDKKHKREKEGKKLEGARIANLVKRRKYKYTTDLSDEGNEGGVSKSQDEFVLRKLFKKSGVHTALSHDAILNCGDPDYLLLESEANRVAIEALRQVRLSRARLLQRRNVSSSSEATVKKKRNFFGNVKNSSLAEEKRREKKKNPHNKAPPKSPPMFNGGIEDDDLSPDDEAPTSCTDPSASNDPSPEEAASSGVLSSAQLLKRMRQRRQLKDNPEDLQQQVPSTVGEDPVLAESLDPYGPITYDPNYPSTALSDNLEGPTDDPEVVSHVELLTDIRNFVAFQAMVDGQASTKEVLQRFAGRLPPSRNHIFKALLHTICDFVRDASGQGHWYLKGEFR